MRVRIHAAFAVAVAAIIACDRNPNEPDISAEVGRFALVSITVPGAAINAVGVSETGTVFGDASFGSDSSGRFQWTNGAFSFHRSKAQFHAIASNRLGDLVGMILSTGGGPAVWYVEDTVPHRLTNADTLISAGYQATRINDHREVAVWGLGAGGIWYAGQFAKNPSSQCYAESMNNQGIEIFWGCAHLGGGSVGGFFVSPFRPTSFVNSGKLASRQCPSGRFEITAINDSNETIGYLGLEAAWRAAGCVSYPDVSNWVTFNSRGLLLGIANRHICATRPSGNICGDALLLNERGSAELDALIDAPAGSWTVAMYGMGDGAETRLTDSGIILTQASLNGGALTWVLLVPS